VKEFYLISFGVKIPKAEREKGGTLKEKRRKRKEKEKMGSKRVNKCQIMKDKR
jgi:hypothetical protein